MILSVKECLRLSLNLICHASAVIHVLVVGFGPAPCSVTSDKLPSCGRPRLSPSVCYHVFVVLFCMYWQ